MNLHNYKFVSSEGSIYAVPKDKWEKYIKLVLAYKLSLNTKNPLRKSFSFSSFFFSKDIKLIACDIFELNKFMADDCIDVIKKELSNTKNFQILKR